jgi:hypothetical protein
VDTAVRALQWELQPGLVPPCTSGSILKYMVCYELQAAIGYVAWAGLELEIPLFPSTS